MRIAEELEEGFVVECRCRRELVVDRRQAVVRCPRCGARRELEALLAMAWGELELGDLPADRGAAELPA